MYNPFAKEVEILKESKVKYDFLLLATNENNLSKKNKSLDYIMPLLDEIEKEKIYLLDYVEDFNTNPNVIVNLAKKGAVVNDFFSMINENLIRIRRFNLILNPVIYDFILKSGVITYDKSSAVWINDNGSKNKNFSRNFGSTEENLVKVLEKTLRRFSNYVTIANISQQKYGDIIARINNINYFFDVKITDKRSIIKMSTLIDMWKHYKTIYY